ncbi:aminopeptidase N-like [Nylanderia fulva]|uniref:aminopeptidase N-like n=1 Tax=Nylanderia fulva TaxID=613905 RepID=UPI0010FAFD98|nr:aminopeptidase N-like [Nylanderia fulva]
MVCGTENLTIYYTYIPYNEDGWTIFNIQQIGYYRVNYDKENWKRIRNYLNSRNYKNIHVLNRAQIIDDAFNLMIAGHLNCSIFWDITSYLYQEEDYIAWYPMFKALEYICNTFPVMKEEIAYMAQLISDTLNYVLKKIKYEEIGDVDELRICLRQEAARWACLLNHINCKREANNQLKQHFQDPSKHELLPWWKEWTYCNALKINSDKLIREAVSVEVSDAKFLEYLACSEDTNTINHYLTYEPYTKEQYQYFRYSFLHIITKHANNQAILKNILNAFFFYVKPKQIDVPIALIIMINNVYSVNLTQEINKYVKWVKNNTDINYGVKGRDFLEKNLDKIESKITIRNNQIKRQIELYYDWFYF